MMGLIGPVLYPHGRPFFLLLCSSSSVSDTLDIQREETLVAFPFLNQTPWETVIALMPIEEAKASASQRRRRSHTVLTPCRRAWSQKDDGPVMDTSTPWLTAQWHRPLSLCLILCLYSGPQNGLRGSLKFSCSPLRNGGTWINLLSLLGTVSCLFNRQLEISIHIHLLRLSGLWL